MPHRPARDYARAALHAVADLIFPRSCIHCGERVEHSGLEHFCVACAREIHLAESPTCQTCGYPFFGVIAGDRSCPHCADLDPVFDRGRTLFLAKGPARSLIHELKYRHGFYVLSDVAQLIHRLPGFSEYLSDATLVPVPLHPTKLRDRGYNQSEAIASALQRINGHGTTVASLLQRVRYTQTQTRLNRSQRDDNVKNAFALKPKTVLNPDFSYILVDDVFTTGATLNACAAVLRDHGARRVKVLTLGHG